jgi:anti-sigma B factor antagonist
MALVLNSRMNRGVVVLSADGRLDAEAAPALLAACESHSARGDCQIVLDLAGVAYVDSKGIEAILAIFQLVGKAGGLRLIGARPQLLQLLEITRLARILGIAADETAAIDSLVGSD